MKHFISLTCNLGLVWILLSGYFTPLLLSFGLISCLLVLWIIQRMRIVDEETLPTHLMPGLPRMLWVLTWETLASNWALAKILLRGGGDIEPGVRTIDFGARKPLTQVAIGNAITLTPGTLTMRVSDEGMAIHALTPDMLEGMEETRMIRTFREADHA